MTTFIDQLTNRLADKKQALKDNLHLSERKLDPRFKAEVARHWHTPLPLRREGAKLPGYAVDGSSRRADLVNGSTLFVAQALLIGEELNERLTDIEILPGTVRSSTMDRFADLMRQSLEIGLAKQFAAKIPEGSILYLDGALYGTLPQLYPLRGDGVPEDRDYATILLNDYHDLFECCERRNIHLISIAKTNRQALFSKILQKRLGRSDAEIQEISDSALFDELTESKMGYSTPVVLGTYSFSAGASTVLLQNANVKSEPAIVSFFVRLNDLDDALRVDVLASRVGRPERIGDLEFDLAAPDSVVPIIEILRGDYGGLQVYNALAYVSDLEVRLTKQKMYDIYLPMIADVLGEDIRIDRSERRFVD
ncbi:MAG: DNA double-strand break repair nuclease NurA [Anaerolineae bacterium]